MSYNWVRLDLAVLKKIALKINPVEFITAYCSDAQVKYVSVSVAGNVSLNNVKCPVPSGLLTPWLVTWGGVVQISLHCVTWPQHSGNQLVVER